MKTLCFTGHRPNKFSFKYDESHPDCIKIKKLLKEETEKAILRGYELFVVGMAIGVDIWSAEIVLELKKTYPHIKLEAAIPCINQGKSWPKSSQERYKNILSQVDIVHYVSREPYKPYLMIKRNKYMVDKSSLFIACFDGSEGGIKDTFDYALKKGIDIVCINPKTMIVTNIVNGKGYYQLTLF